mgnify:FL=1
MELIFLGFLVFLMILFLASGFPVAFTLPGSAILSILAAAFFGYVIEGDASAYFIQDGPIQWLNAGVTNFRSLYWDVERDTLIAIPLFVFMGIMLQKSKIAEDLLVSMAQLFGSVPGGLGISVVLVGALLAATTGIVGATVIAMGLISLPAMLKHNYSKSLSTGTICASGTLGQIIPPSIVLIILADQLSNAADIANNSRSSEYRTLTGDFSLPTEFSVISTSAGEMFVGAFLPGIVLVGLYVLYILIFSLFNPDKAPPVSLSKNFDKNFIFSLFISLIPPLALIFLVLGSIILGIATVNQAGAIGAIGAMIMGGYKLTEDSSRAYYPSILFLGSLLFIIIILYNHNLNIKNIVSETDIIILILTFIAVTILFISIFWSFWRIYRYENTLSDVMIETSKTTSMVFIILLGAAMLTSAFRGFGGEELVKDFLVGIPGGFWAQFLVVMIVIFLLGFFLDFIEIAVVVVPLVAPILLADPAANISAVWLGVMIGLNLQTSFLTPPFGFALFYLRGVAPIDVKTTHIYKGVIVFIFLQIIGLLIVGFFPPLVNYLPNRTYLTSENAPPPINPKLQQCMEEDLFVYYDLNEESIRNGVAQFSQTNFDYLPEKLKKSLDASQTKVLGTFQMVRDIQTLQKDFDDFNQEYRSLHFQVRSIQKEIRTLDQELEELKQRKNRLIRSKQDALQEEINRIDETIKTLEEIKTEKLAQVPENWKSYRAIFEKQNKDLRSNRMKYRRNVDEAYEPIKTIKGILKDTDALRIKKNKIESIGQIIMQQKPDGAMKQIKLIEKELGNIEGSSSIKSKISKARRALKGKNPNREKANKFWKEALTIFDKEMQWRQKALSELIQPLDAYDTLIKDSIGLRSQKKLGLEQAKSIAVCKSSHQDISLNF